MPHRDLVDPLISIHALRKESDLAAPAQTQTPRFQSTLSVRRATAADAVGMRVFLISIHALRKESDPCASQG